MGLDRTADFHALATCLARSQPANPKLPLAGPSGGPEAASGVSADASAVGEGRGEGQEAQWGTTTHVAGFTATLLPVLSKIKEMKRLLNQNRHRYLQLGHTARHAAFGSHTSEMSDQERSDMDTEITKFYAREKLNLHQLSQTLPDLALSNHAKQHCVEVVKYVAALLESVMNDLQQMSKQRLKVVKRHENTLSSHSYNVQNAVIGLAERGHAVGGFDEQVQDDFAGEELEDLQTENNDLLTKLNTELDQVRLAEAQVMSISGMMTYFRQKLFEQEEVVEMLHSTAEESAENMAQGNEYLKDTLEREKGSRFLTLFIVMLASFSLIFLDWYTK